jgi:hypothetical protein
VGCDPTQGADDRPSEEPDPESNICSSQVHAERVYGLELVHERADEHGVSNAPIEVWMLVLGVAAAAVVSSLYVLSSLIRDHGRVVELDREVRRLRMEYAKRRRDLAARSGLGEAGPEPVTGEVDIVEAEPASRAA